MNVNLRHRDGRVETIELPFFVTPPVVVLKDDKSFVHEHDPFRLYEYREVFAWSTPQSPLPTGSEVEILPGSNEGGA